MGSVETRLTGLAATAAKVTDLDKEVTSLGEEVQSYQDCFDKGGQATWLSLAQRHGLRIACGRHAARQLAYSSASCTWCGVHSLSGVFTSSAAHSASVSGTYLTYPVGQTPMRQTPMRNSTCATRVYTRCLGLITVPVNGIMKGRFTTALSSFVRARTLYNASRSLSCTALRLGGLRNGCALPVQVSARFQGLPEDSLASLALNFKGRASFTARGGSFASCVRHDCARVQANFADACVARAKVPRPRHTLVSVASAHTPQPIPQGLAWHLLHTSVL